MNDELSNLMRESNKQIVTICIVGLISMAIVCSIACMSIAHVISSVSADYFNYEVSPTTITNTQTNNNE